MTCLSSAVRLEHLTSPDDQRPRHSVEGAGPLGHAQRAGQLVTQESRIIKLADPLACVGAARAIRAWPRCGPGLAESGVSAGQGDLKSELRHLGRKRIELLIFDQAMAPGTPLGPSSFGSTESSASENSTSATLPCWTLARAHNRRPLDTYTLCDVDANSQVASAVTQAATHVGRRGRPGGSGRCGVGRTCRSGWRW